MSADLERRLAALERDLSDVRTREKLGASGTAFPTGPATNALFYRTDLDWWCFYDGTRWLTVHEYVHPLGATVSTAAATNTDFVIRTDYAPYVTRVSVVSFVATTNNGANYWTVTISGLDGGKTSATTVLAFNTSADLVNNYISHEAAPSTANPTNRTYWRMGLAITLGAPGVLTVGVALYYRLIVT